MTEDVKNKSASGDADATDERGRANEEQTNQIEETTSESKVATEASGASDDSSQNTEKETTSTENEDKLETKSSAEDHKSSADAQTENSEETVNKKTGSKDSTSMKEGKDKSNETAEKATDDGAVDTIEIEIKADSAKKNREEFQAEIRDQIENCKFEIIGALQEHIHDELEHFQKQTRKIERRRRAGVITRDIIILVLAVIIGFLSYWLYDAKYFDFMKSDCERNNNCDVATTQTDPEVKSAEWYKQNYGYLFDSLQTKLDADKVSAYYLYTDDHKASEMQTEYLLGMAYNRLNSNITYDSNDGIIVPANDLRQAYIDLIGNADNFKKTNFTYHCADFEYRKDSDDFTAKSLLCADTADRQIVEEIDEIYEEGNVLYFLTTATIYDRTNNSFYSFDNLFKPVVKNVTEDDLAEHKSLLNQYQYQFKKSNGKYYFSGIVKLS